MKKPFPLWETRPGSKMKRSPLRRSVDLMRGTLSSEISLKCLVQLKNEKGLDIPLPMHQSPCERVSEFGLVDLTEILMITSPIGYLGLMSLTQDSAAVVSDSRGYKKEVYFAVKKAVIVMPDTGWREPTELKWHIFARPEKESVLQATMECLQKSTNLQAIYCMRDSGNSIVHFLMQSANQL